MTATGAWFTDSKVDQDVTGTGTFGKVSIGTATVGVSMKEGDANTIDKLVPGCELKLSGSVTNDSTVKVYYRYKVVATVTCADAETKTALEALFDDLAEWSDPATLDVGEDVDNLNGTYTIPTSIENGAQEASVTFKLSVQFTQFDHQNSESIVWSE